jgi:hypothetical protein
MRIDALILDLAAAVRILKEETVSLFETSELAAELASANTGQDDSATALHTKLKAAIAAKDFVSLPDMIEAGRAALSGLLQIKAAEARRSAILRVCPPWDMKSIHRAWLGWRRGSWP